MTEPESPSDTIVNGRRLTIAEKARWEKENQARFASNLAEMFEAQRGPFLMTDSEFLKGEETGYKYISQIADYPGDPKAYVSGRGDIQRICEERGWGCHGAVKCKVNDLGREPPKGVDMDPKLVEEYADRMIEQDPGLAEKPREEVKERVFEKHAPHWSRSKKKPKKKIGV